MKAAILLSALAFNGFAYGVPTATGFVTPSEMTITFTGASLTTTDNQRKTIVATGSYPITFKRTDTDFAAVTAAAAGVDAGRYIGVQICYNSSRTVKLNGDLYEGSTGAAVTSADHLWSVGTDAMTANAVSSTTNPTPTTLTGYQVGNGTNQCSESYFVNPVCVTTSGTTGCEATDTALDTSVTPPNLSVMLDMYDSVGIDAATGALYATPIYPYPAFGKPGAAVHLHTATAANVGNISLIFGSDGNLIYTSSYQVGSNTGFCSIGGGVGFVSVTAGPTGAFINSYGPTAVQKLTAPGKIEFAAGGCTGSTCNSNGLQTIDNIKQAVGTTPAITCENDGTGALGYTYTGNAAASTGAGTVTVKRIIDPSNILGSICTTGGGICGTY